MVLPINKIWAGWGDKAETSLANPFLQGSDTSTEHVRPFNRSFQYRIEASYEIKLNNGFTTQRIFKAAHKSEKLWVIKGNKSLLKWNKNITGK